MTTPSTEATVADLQQRLVSLQMQLDRTLQLLSDISKQRDTDREDALAMEQQRDQAEERFIKAREENSGLEQEVSDLTNELVMLRHKLTHYEGAAAARRARILEKMEHPMIMVPANESGAVIPPLADLTDGQILWLIAGSLFVGICLAVIVLFSL